MAQSTAEVEYVSACEACMEGQGLRNKFLLQVFANVNPIFRMGIDGKESYIQP